jgi:hypothetical protein
MDALGLLPYVITASCSLVCSALLVAGGQLVQGFAWRKVQDEKDIRHEADHKRFEQDLLGVKKVHEEDMALAKVDQEKITARLEELISSTVAEQKETNQHLLKLIGVVGEVTAANKTLNVELDRLSKGHSFLDARLRDAERIIGRLEAIREVKAQRSKSKKATTGGTRK